MKYMGSKRRISKDIFQIIDFFAREYRLKTWFEPFVGGANMIEAVPESYTRVGSDSNPHVIAALLDIRDNPDILPEEISEFDYAQFKGLPAGSVVSWARFVCSFGGKFGAGFARAPGRNFAAEGKRSATKQSRKLQGVEFFLSDFSELRPRGCVIYCDPPYSGVTGYSTGGI